MAGPKGRTQATIERDVRALKLRQAGATYHEIGQTLGIDQALAHRSVHRAIRDTLAEPAKAVVDLEVSRLDRMLMAVWPAASQGNLSAVDRVISISARRARLLGLDAPIRTHQGFLGADGELVDPAQFVASVIAALGQFVRDLLAAPELELPPERQQIGLEVGGRLMRSLPAPPIDVPA